ncbi:GM12250 [Drosophila sechellia]|uniref:GM12250 n=1 Tax=Drosophila sechellia TaxID=7238 RepID=B4HZ85_DROSE|nr:GM12250 [Drosophila sechellia]
MKWLVLVVITIGFGLATPISTYNHYRLPTALRPIKYDLHVLTQLENADAFRFGGSVDIKIQVLENTNNITVHSKELTIDETATTLRQIGGADLKDNCVSSTEVNPEHDFYVLRTCRELLAGQVYEVSLRFSSTLSDRLEGYYRSSYVDPVANETRWISITHFEPASARLAFPCFDEPGYKAPFSITLRYHKKFTGLSNMPVKRTGKDVPKTIQDLPGPDQWVIFNNQLSAPYKVNYDAQNWKLLIETLNSEDYQCIHVVNRAQTGRCHVLRLDRGAGLRDRFAGDQLSGEGTGASSLEVGLRQSEVC